MDASTIIAKARKQTWTDATNYTTANAVEDLNFVYQDIISDIQTEVDEDYFWDEIKADWAQNQSEYSIIEIWTGATAKKITKVNAVSIKYSSDWQYVPAKYINPQSLTKDKEWYKTNQPTTDPFYYISDDSFFVYPAPTSAVTDWLKLEVLYTPLDLTSTSTEDDIKISPRFHKVIIAGMRALVFEARMLINEATDAQNKYEVAKTNMIAQLKGRNQWIVQVQDPNLNSYC